LAVIVESLVNDKLPTLEHSPLYQYIVSEPYGGKLAAMLGVSLSRAIRVGSLKITLGGVSPW
jgi:serine carboxypeptidase 1